MYNKAVKISVDICMQLHKYCDKINIAGSIRRQKSEVKDIEIVCYPKIITVLQDNLFGEKNTQTYISHDFISTVNSLGKIVKGNPSGKMMQIQLPEIMLDLFIPDYFDYYRQYAIRTGSSLYSQKIIASGWLKKGWCGSDKGLRKQSDCNARKKPDGKTEWICINKNSELPPIWESEEHFFNWIGVKYINPTQRNL